MKEILRKWLNGNRDYFRGAIIFSELSPDKKLAELYLKGPTDYTKKRLPNDLMAIYKAMCQMTEDHVVKIPAKTPSHKNSVTLHAVKIQTGLPVETTDHAGSEIYKEAKKKADIRYKEVMNLRAELFSICREDVGVNVNSAESINKRCKMAIDIVSGFNEASKMYELADFVLKHGRYPTGSDMEEKEPPVWANVPNAMVKQTLDNMRKNLNKIRKKETTPERSQRIAELESGIAQLEERWRLLKHDA